MVSKSVILARRMGKYEYCSKEGGWQFVQLCRVLQAINSRRAKDQYTFYAVCSLLHISSSHCHQHIRRKLKTPLQIRSSTHRLDCHCYKNYLHRSIKSQWIRISTLLRELVLDKRTDWTSQRWGEWLKKRGPGSLAHASLSCIHQLKTDTWNFVALGSLTNSENHLMRIL